MTSTVVAEIGTHAEKFAFNDGIAVVAEHVFDVGLDTIIADWEGTWF